MLFRHLTVAQLNQGHVTADLVNLVGKIVRCDDTAGGACIFHMCDGTGTVCLYKHNTKTMKFENIETRIEREKMAHLFDIHTDVSWDNGKYMSFIVRPSKSQDDMVVIQDMRPVEDMNEITYHSLQAIYEHQRTQ